MIVSTLRTHEPKAITYYEDSLDISKSIGDREGEAETSWILGNILKDKKPRYALDLMEVAYDYTSKIAHHLAEGYKPIVEEQRRRVAQQQPE